MSSVLKVYDENTSSWIDIPAIQGDTGTAAGFGTPTATVGANTGTPSVSVTASGPDTAKVFSFAFDGLKGANGANGVGVPSGGAQGQVLTKSSATDYDTAWANASGGSDKVMRVTVIYSNRTYSSDKTFDEILTAINDGYWVFVWYEAHEYELRDYSSSLIRFQKITMSSVANTSIDYVNIYKSNNQTTVTVSSDNIERTKTQLIYELVEDGNGGYEWDQYNEYPLINIYDTNPGSAYLYIKDIGTLPHTGQDDVTEDFYQLEKYWQTEVYYEEESQWETISHAIFSKIEEDNDTKKYKKFELTQWNGYWSWGSEYTTVTYSEETVDAPLIVTIEQATYYIGNQYTIDSTYSAIDAAVKSGREVILRGKPNTYYLSETVDYNLAFYRPSDNSTGSYVFRYIETLTSGQRGVYFRTFTVSYNNPSKAVYGTISYTPEIPYISSMMINYTNGTYSCPYYSSQLNDFSLAYHNLRYAFVYLYNNDMMPYTGENKGDGDYYPLNKYWNDEIYDEDEQEYCVIGHALFAKTVMENGTLKYKQFLLEGNQYTYGDITVTYTETTLGQGAPSAQGVSF